jgi:putative endonuclease
MLKYFYTYILECSYKSFYTGITDDIERRLIEHNSNEYPQSYCHERRPVKLVFAELFLQPEPAIEFEKQIKGWNRKKKEALIEKNFERLKELAVCKNETSHLNYKKNKKLNGG